MLEHVLCHLKFRIKISYFIESTLISGRIDLLISDLINLRDGHISYFGEFTLSDAFAYFLLDHTLLL